MQRSKVDRVILIYNYAHKVDRLYLFGPIKVNLIFKFNQYLLNY